MIPLGTQADCIRRILNGIQQSSTTENIISAFEAAGIVRTYNKRSIKQFNDNVPYARVEQGYARFYKDAAFEYHVDNWRIDLC